MGDRSSCSAKRKFSQDEDTLLRTVISRGICSDWCEVARELPGRSARQCRERWNNYVNPMINHGAWTKAEDELLIKKCKELGSKWEVIVKSFPYRSKNQIKNHWFTHQRRIKTICRDGPGEALGTRKWSETRDSDRRLHIEDSLAWETGHEVSPASE
jgi:hypothetical protein